MRGAQVAMRNPVASQSLRECRDRRRRTRHDGDHRRVHGGDLNAIAEQCTDVGLGQANRQHRSARHAVDHATSGRDQSQRRLQRNRARQARSAVFTDAVPDHCGRRHAVCFPELRQPVRHGEERRLRDEGLVQQRAARLRTVKHDRTDVLTCQWLQNFRTLIDGCAEHRFRLVVLSPHAGELRALAGEQERHWKAAHR